MRTCFLQEEAIKVLWEWWSRLPRS